MLWPLYILNWTVIFNENKKETVCIKIKFFYWSRETRAWINRHCTNLRGSLNLSNYLCLGRSHGGRPFATSFSFSRSCSSYERERYYFNSTSLLDTPRRDTNDVLLSSTVTDLEIVVKTRVFFQVVVCWFPNFLVICEERRNSVAIGCYLPN